MKITFTKSTLFITLFAAFAMIITSCSKDKKVESSTQINPTTHTYYYYVSNQFNEYTADSCFHFTFTYLDADGSTVTVENPEFPWTKAVTATSGFTDKLEGEITYDTTTMPDFVCFAKAYNITFKPDNFPEGEMTRKTKEMMIQILTQNPEFLTFSKTFPTGE